MRRLGWLTCWTTLLAVVVAGCAGNPDKRTISQLRDVDPDLRESHVNDSLVKAMESYRHFLNETPTHTMAPEAMRRLADLQIEKEYGIIGDAAVVDLPAPEAAQVPAPATSGATSLPRAASGESDLEFETRTTRHWASRTSDSLSQADLPEGSEPMDLTGPTQAIETYQRILTDYPWYERNDQVLYQMARAYDELAQPDEAMRVVDRLISEYPESRYVDEVYFRRGEYFFVRKKYLDAEEAYLAVVGIGEASSFYELALYKLGWSLYKQELYEAALHQYIALLDYKLSIGYDFEAKFGTPDDATDGEISVDSEGDREGEGEERRVADTFRVVSLSFSNLGGPEVLNEYFSAYGGRVYEDRIYRNLAEFHLTKRRYNDAAAVYQGFVELNPFHKVAPHFSMRVSEVYTEGNFPLLVVEAKRDFAKRYGVNAEYWHYFEIESKPDVLEFLKTNLTDLAGHYHALYQQEGLEDDRGANFAEASQWYREFLDSFPQDEQSPPINYKLADLLLENQDFAHSALEYERTAYDYPEHSQASAAGYAAIYAHRENLKVVTGAQAQPARRATVDSSLRFAEVFPAHEHAATVLGAAVEDLYDMQDYEGAIAAAQWLIEAYPDADTGLRRAAWMIAAHSSFDLGRYPEAELAYVEVLALSHRPEEPPESEASEAYEEERQGVVDNLAASIYKQGEQARLMEDYVAAADHFLRIKTAAPTSEIRAAAEYDGAAALIHLEDWLGAADVLEDFRSSYPEHELNTEATKQLAVVYESAGDLTRSAAEYERVADDSSDPEFRREAILVAGGMYEEAGADSEALRVYERYIQEFQRPLDPGLEIRFKVARMYDERGRERDYHAQLEAIVEIDRDAGSERSDRSRFLAAQSSLVLSRPIFRNFADLALAQPFDQSLAEKKRRMDLALETFEALVAYQVGEVTAAATFYIAEIYGNFSDALLASERPAGLSPADLADYELVIEEEAYPFEERSIDVHQENLELVRVGVFNEWVQRSIDELAVMMPGRYAKPEISGGFLGSIDSYAYRSPVVPVVPVVPTEDGIEVEAPAPGDVSGDVSGEDAPDHASVDEPESVSPPPNDLAGVDDVVLPF